MMFKIKQTNCLFVNFEKRKKKLNEIGNISFFLNNNKCHICGINLSDNEKFMCYECHICGISLSDNKEFMCCECLICGISLSDNEEYMHV